MFYSCRHWELKNRVPAWLGSGETLFWIVDFWLCPHVAQGPVELFGVSFIRAVSPFMRLYPYDLSISQMPHFLIPSHWALGFQYTNWGGGMNIQIRVNGFLGRRGNL